LDEHELIGDWGIGIGGLRQAEGIPSAGADAGTAATCGALLPAWARCEWKMGLLHIPM